MPRLFPTQILRARAGITALALGLLCPPAGAQPAPTVAELERRVASAPAAEKPAALLALSRILESIDMTRAADAARQARVTATTPRDEMLADARLATVLRRQGDYPAALALVRPGLARAIELGDDPARAELLYVSANIHWSLTDYPASIAAHQELIGLAEKIGNRYFVGRAHLGMGVIYAESQQKPKARLEAEAALRIATELGDREFQADCLNNLGNNYRGAGELDRARAAHERALAIRTQLGSRRAMADSLINLGEVERVRGDYPAALDYARRAFAIYEQLGVKRYLANTHAQFALIHRLSGRPDDALEHLRRGFVLAAELKSHVILANYHREFAAVHEARGDLKSALESQRQLAVATDATLGEKTRQQLAVLNARFDAERRQQEIALLRRDQALQAAALERAHLQRYGLIAVLALGGLAVGAIISRQRLKLRTERLVLEEARAAQRAAEEADRVKTRFLGVASHDIRGPLGNIVSLAGTLREAPTDREALAEHCDLIGSEAQRVMSLVEDLITTAALESGKLELRIAPLDLVELTRTVIAGLRWQADAKRQDIAFAAPLPGAGRLEGDAARLEQVVANLLSNAIKFSPPGQTIAVALTRTDEHVALAVRDQGAGIAVEEIARLFAPFARLATRPTAGESSHGLGLSIAQEIVRLHGGRIRVESQPGAGATFVAELPLRVRTPGPATIS